MWQAKLDHWLQNIPLLLDQIRIMLRRQDGMSNGDSRVMDVTDQSKLLLHQPLPDPQLLQDGKALLQLDVVPVLRQALEVTVTKLERVLKRPGVFRYASDHRGFLCSVGNRVPLRWSKVVGLASAVEDDAGDAGDFALIVKPEAAARLSAAVDNVESVLEGVDGFGELVVGAVIYQGKGEVV